MIHSFIRNKPLLSGRRRLTDATMMLLLMLMLAIRKLFRIG